MKQIIWSAMCATGWLAGLSAVSAQEPIYRCGNEYINNPAVAKQRNCPLIEGGHVTIVHRAATSTAGSHVAAEPKASPVPSASRSAKIDPQQQKARDSDARSILQAELAKAQERLNAAKLEFNDGHPIQSALELRNPQVFNERLEQLKANIARQERDVAGIQRELERHPGG